MVKETEFRVRPPLWATEEGDPWRGFRVSREYALDWGLPEADVYPVWAGYPDERGTERGLAARVAWGERLRTGRFRYLEGRMTKKVVLSKSDVVYDPKNDIVQVCARPGCGRPPKEHKRGKPSIWCSDACRKAVERQKAAVR